MGLKAGIIGLPNVGKSTIFNALTKSEIPAENYPFCTIDPNVGVVEVPDKRINEIYGLVKGAGKGGPGKQISISYQGYGCNCACSESF